MLLLPFRETIELTGYYLAETVGVLTPFIFVLFVDTFIVPASPDLIFPVVVRWNPWLVILLSSAGSILGGLFGYLIGRYLNHFQFVRQVTATYRSQGEHLIRRYGVWAIVIAAVTPIPFSTVSWIAGMVHAPIGSYFFGALFRIPRLAAAFLLLRAGVEFIELFGI